MRKFVLALALLGGALVAVPASADTPAAQLQYLIGTWDCSVTGGMSFTETNMFEPMPGGSWIHGSGTAQSQQGSIVTASYLEWDATSSRWVLVSILSSGLFTVATSASPSLNGSSWNEVYPTSGDTATITENSPTQYTVERSGVMAGHKAVIDEICRKQ